MMVASVFQRLNHFETAANSELGLNFAQYNNINGIKQKEQMSVLVPT